VADQQKIDRYAEHLLSAKKHCLLSLLDYADALKKNEKDEKVKSAIESMKKRVHNDVAAFHQRAGALITLAVSGGDVPPFGNGEK
jgi:hypothetical protein